MTSVATSHTLWSMSQSLAVPTINDAGLFTRAQALTDGFTDKDLRHPDFRRVIHGVYALSEISPSHLLKCRAASMVLPVDAVLIGRSAAVAHGVPLAHAGEPVEVIGKRRYRHQGIYPRDLKTQSDEHTPWSGIRLATPVRTAFDLLARNPMQHAVAYCDALIHDGLVTIAEIANFIALNHYYGIRRARATFPLLDGRAESIPESVLRLVLVQDGLTPVPQFEVFDIHGFVARVDLGFPEAKVAVEYDGAWHSDPEQSRRDRVRRQRLRACGWRVIVVIAHRLANDRKGILADVWTALTQPD